MIVTIDGKKFRVDVMNWSELNSSHIEQWSDLEQRSIEGNAYLSPHFILPALKHLTPAAKVIFIFVANIEGNTSTLTGVGVFEYCRGSKTFPLPHFKAYRSPHSYLSGLLVDEEFVDSTLSVFFKVFGSLGGYSCGVEFTDRPHDTRLAKRLEIVASRLHIAWHQYGSRQRGVLIPNNLQSDYLQHMLSQKIKKKLRYSWNVLLKIGEIRWNAVVGQKIDTECIDRFLNLEHTGWKGTNGTSILSNSNDEIFFREMIHSFAQRGCAFITELSVNNRVIASTANMISSRMGYAFKIGWDAELAQASPGVLNEVEFIKKAAELFPHLEYIDSGAEEGSFIDKLWHDRYTLVSGFFLTKALSNKVFSAMDYARRFKQRVRHAVKKTNVAAHDILDRQIIYHRKENQ